MVVTSDPAVHSEKENVDFNFDQVQTQTLPTSQDPPPVQQEMLFQAKTEVVREAPPSNSVGNFEFMEQKEE